MITISGFTQRLGNQLFQIAAAWTHAQKNNIPFLCPSWPYQKHFKTKFPLYEGSPIENYYKEWGFNYNEIPLLPNLSISGYFQSYKYFNEKEIQDLFSFVNEFESHPFPDRYASIHVRRTDYLKYPDHHPICSLEYYRKAIEASGYSKFVIFSDDPEWCREHLVPSFKDFEFVVSRGRSDMEDFQLMAQYKCNIIANSTFSWWAAMLNKNKDKKIITPSEFNWHGKGYADFDHSDLLPKEWIQINF